MKTFSALFVLTLCCTGWSVFAQNKDLTTGQQALAGSDWRLVSIGKVGAEVSVVTGTSVTLKFGKDERVSGSGGCNSYGGSYRVEGDRITFSQVFSTRRACTDPNANRQESEYLQALGSANRFRLVGQGLSIYYDRGRSVLQFADANATSDRDEGTLNDVDDPVSALIAYYRAIDSRDYRRAYRYWESPAQGLDQFARGFSDTTSVRLLLDPSPQVEGAAGSSYASIATVVISTRNRGGERLFAGCYVMRKSNLGAEDGQTRRGWRIYRAEIQPVSDAARASTVIMKMCNN